MALMPRLRQLLRRSGTASTVGTRRPSSSRRRGDTVHEDALRAVLSENPNDERAFQALAEVVRRHAAQAHVDEDPLAAEGAVPTRRREADLAEWALAEELAGNPKAWYPLVELARLSIGDDHEGTLRRLATAAERDPSGQALANGLELLREAGMPVDALGLGVGHWRPREHVAEAGRQVVLAALDAERPLDARIQLDALVAGTPHKAEVRAFAGELDSRIEQSRQRTAGA
jgi:hypothetical protein